MELKGVVQHQLQLQPQPHEFSSSRYEVLRAYLKMREDGMMPNIRTIVGALKVCGRTGDVQNGERIHRDVEATGDIADVFVANTLLDMYAKIGKLGNAQKLFEELPRATVASWNIMILAYAQNGKGEAALDLYDRMIQARICPSHVTFIAALKACACLAKKESGRVVDGRSKPVKLRALERTRAVHAEITKLQLLELKLANTMIDVYARCWSLDEARSVFNSIRSKDVVSWNCLIMGYVQTGEAETALQLYARMSEEGYVPSCVTLLAAVQACCMLADKEEDPKAVSLERGRSINLKALNEGLKLSLFVESCLVTFYVKCGSMTEAWRVFERMPRKDTVAWTSIISGYAAAGEGRIALELFEMMQEDGCIPDQVAIVAALKACTALVDEAGIDKAEALKRGRSIHLQALRSMEMNIFAMSTLVTFYAKCGSMGEAQSVFNAMASKDVITWTAIIMGYAQNGDGDSALHLYCGMRKQGYVPNALTYVAALKACGVIGAAEFGTQLHKEIVDAKLDEDPMLTSSLIDFYSRCGYMGNAEAVFWSSTTRDEVSWGALMNGYSRQGDATMVLNLFDKMVNEERGVKPNRVILLAVLVACSHAGLIDQGLTYFGRMESNYGVRPCMEHYSCMVDLLCRANRLQEALSMVDGMPWQPSKSMWMTILGASRQWNDLVTGRRAFDALQRFEGAEACSLMASIYSGA